MNRISSLSGEDWVHKTGLTPPYFNEVITGIPSQESERSCICELRVFILPLYLRFFNEILELFRQCVIFCFSFDHLTNLTFTHVYVLVRSIMTRTVALILPLHMSTSSSDPSRHVR